MKDIVRILRRVEQIVLGDIPEGREEPNPINRIIFKMFARTVSRYQSICLLLEDGRVEEAAILLRSLLEMSHELLFLRQRPQERGPLALGWWNRTLRDQAEWITAIKRVDPDGDEDFVLNKLKKDGSQLQRAQKVLGIEKLKAFPARGPSMIRALGRKEDELHYLLATKVSHNSGVMLYWYLSKPEEKTEAIALRDSDPFSILGVAEVAIRLILELAVAVAEMLSWESTISNETRRTIDETLKQFGEELRPPGITGGYSPT